MKRKIILLIVLCACLFAARAEGKLLRPEGDGWVEDIFSDGETLYLKGHGLYTWRPGEDGLTAWEDGVSLPASGEGLWREAFDGLTLFADGEGLHGARLEKDGDGAVTALQLCDLVLTERGTVEAQNIVALEAPKALQDSGLYLSTACVADGVLYMLGEDDVGALILTVDTADPRQRHGERLSVWDCRLFPGGDGPVLQARDEEANRLTLWRVAPDGTRTPLCALPEGSWGVAVDGQTGAVFATVDGRVCPVDAGTGEPGAPVAAVPLSVSRAALLDGGRWYAALLSDRTVLVADTARPLDESAVLAVRSDYTSDWMDGVLARFAAEHPEAPLRTVTERGGDAAVLDAMLTRSQAVDVYVLGSLEAGTFEALLKRGYMLPLDGSGALQAFYEGMTPGFRDWTGSDGRVCALPVFVIGRGVGFSEPALEALGLGLSDVPGDWSGFLDFLEGEILPRLDRLPEGVGFTFDDMTDRALRGWLRDQALRDWVNSCDAAGVAPDYEDARLVAVLEKLDGMDFTAFGVPEDSGEEDGWYGWSGNCLLALDAPYGFDGGDSDAVPVPLGFGDALPATMPFDMYAAFVNPYSAHPEAAAALVEAMLDALDPRVAYVLRPDLTEPVTEPDWEQKLDLYRQEIERQRALVDTAAPEDRQALENDMRYMEGELEDYEARGRWLVSPEQLKRFRARGDIARPAVSDWFRKDTSGEAWELLKQYDAGLLSAREFLAAVNRKARMMALEG